MSPESGSREPVTEAGRRLFGRLWAVNDYATVSRIIATVDFDIRAVESEAVSRFAEALRTAVEERDHDYALHDNDLSDADQWTDAQMQTYSATVAGVLHLIERLSQAPADTGEGA